MIKKYKYDTNTWIIKSTLLTLHVVFFSTFLHSIFFFWQMTKSDLPNIFLVLDNTNDVKSKIQEKDFLNE